MKYALLTTAILSLALPALADRLPGTPEYTAHEAVIRDCVIEKAGGHEAFGEPRVPLIPLHPTIRAVKPIDPHAPKFEVDLGYGRQPSTRPSTVNCRACANRDGDRSA